MGGDPGRLGFLLDLRGMMKPKENYPRQMNQFILICVN